MRDITVLITACGNVYMPGTAASVKNNGERNIRLIGADMNHDDTILQMFDQEEKMLEYGKCAAAHAGRTHDGQKNYERLLEIYREIAGK